MSELDDPDGMIMEICLMLLTGRQKEARIKHKLSFRQRGSRYEAVVEITMFDIETKTSMSRKFAVGTGSTVARARGNLLQELTRRAQAIVDMPVKHIMES